ncbi:hypothetical protein [Streptomyces acidiscabies]|uniref:hypothetical protein n=1 Tax=Streptomyces acidiscabies TaxID=42234 RepID=UPI0038F637E0
MTSTPGRPAAHRPGRCHARWASNTVNQGWTARFQTDGNVVAYDGSQAIRATGTSH